MFYDLQGLHNFIFLHIWKWGVPHLTLISCFNSVSNAPESTKLRRNIGRQQDLILCFYYFYVNEISLSWKDLLLLYSSLNENRIRPNWGPILNLSQYFSVKRTWKSTAYVQHHRAGADSSRKLSHLKSISSLVFPFFNTRHIRFHRHKT